MLLTLALLASGCLDPSVGQVAGLAGSPTDDRDASAPTDPSGLFFEHQLDACGVLVQASTSGRYAIVATPTGRRVSTQSAFDDDIEVDMVIVDFARGTMVPVPRPGLVQNAPGENIALSEDPVRVIFTAEGSPDANWERSVWIFDIATGQEVAVQTDVHIPGDLEKLIGAHGFVDTEALPLELPYFSAARREGEHVVLVGTDLYQLFRDGSTQLLLSGLGGNGSLKSASRLEAGMIMAGAGAGGWHLFDLEAGTSRALPDGLDVRGADTRASSNGDGVFFVDDGEPQTLWFVERVDGGTVHPIEAIPFAMGLTFGVTGTGVAFASELGLSHWSLGGELTVYGQGCAPVHAAPQYVVFAELPCTEPYTIEQRHAVLELPSGDIVARVQGRRPQVVGNSVLYNRPGSTANGHPTVQRLPVGDPEVLDSNDRWYIHEHYAVTGPGGFTFGPNKRPPRPLYLWSESTGVEALPGHSAQSAQLGSAWISWMEENASGTTCTLRARPVPPTD